MFVMARQIFHIGQKVYYVQPSYGEHTVVDYHNMKDIYLLELKGVCGGRFWARPDQMKSIIKP